MIGDEVLEAAVAQGIIDATQAARLRDFARTSAGQDAREEPYANPDDERFRLIGGFNDVFVTIGVLLLVAALVGLARVIDFRPGIAVLALVAAWGLAEIFSRRMRLALPSIALALMFAGAGAVLGSLIGGGVLDLVIGPFGTAADDIRGNYFAYPILVFAGAGASIAAALHERRFHVPIDTAIAAAGLICIVAGVLSLLAPEWARDNKAVQFALFGLALFAVAVRVDASDPLRRTRRADVAFWLHLLAAPMIVHAVISLVTGSVTGINTAQAIMILVVFILLGIVALIIDRRALLVSGLSYAGVAIAYLLSQSVERGMGMSLTLLGLAGVVLGLSAGWRALRQTILPLLPLGALRQYVPPATY